MRRSPLLVAAKFAVLPASALVTGLALVYGRLISPDGLA
jgi:hypothetical protein